MVERALQRLTAADSPLRDELVTDVIDHALSLPLRELVDLHEVRELVLGAFTATNARRIVARHVHPGYRRYAQAIAGSDARVGALVPDAARARIAAIAATVRIPRGRWAEGAVDPALLRRLVSPVWTKVLLSFAARLPIPGFGGLANTGGRREGASVTGFIARSVQSQAQKVADRGRTVMSGLGIDVDKRIADVARGFSDSAAQIFRQALRERLASPEGQELLAQITTAAITHVLNARFSDLQVDLNDLPLDEAFEVAPEIVAHAAHSDYVREIVERELEAWLALEADRPARDLLDELGVYEPARARMLARGQAVTARFLQKPPFADWLARVLAE
jgi:hypothetical protein